jgi:TonB-linked SusC/RagA family outer membrane protein
MILNQKSKHILLINKLLKTTMRTFIFLFCTLAFSFNPENGFSQDAIIQIESTKMLSGKQIFKLINQQTDYKFIYRSNLLKDAPKLLVNQGEIKPDELLKAYLGPLNLTYELSENNTVIVKKVIVSKSIARVLISKEDEENDIQRIISGTIVDSDGVPLPGASIIEVGTGKGTSSDFDGNFSFSLENEQAELEISFIGFENQILTITDQDNITITLLSSNSSLDEIVITGYGTSLKKELVSSIAQVKGSDLANQPASSVNGLLQGRAAGLEITSPNGSPEATPTIRIRGLSSIQGNNSPLFVIDGFIAGTDFNLQNINVNDIRTIEVLKDASALAIYGTRGAAGVILIETKNGKSSKEGENNISINHYTSFSRIANQPEFLNGDDFANYWNEAETLVFGASGYGENDSSIAPLFDGPLPNSDWLGLVTRNGLINNTDLTLSGNAKKSNYYISLNRWSEQAIIKSSGMDRYALRANFDSNINNKLRIGFRVNISDRKTENQKVGWNDLQNKSTPTREVYNPDGTYNGIDPVSNSPARNSLADVNERINHTFSTNLLTNSYLEYDITPELSIKSSIGLGLDFRKQNQYFPTILPDRAAQGRLGEASIFSRNSRDILNENTINYSKKFGDHSLKLLAGYTVQKTTFETSRAGAYGFVNDVVSFNNLSLGSDPSQNSVESSYSQRTFESILGRINYSYQSKYLLTLVARRDGSSVFEQGNKHAVFPSAGVAWNVSEEDFMQDMDHVSNLKLRASYGIVGEQGVPAYNSLSRYSPYVTYLNNVVRSAVLLEDLASSNLNWETTYQTDIGLEIGFLNNRYSLEVDYYNKRTEDLLLNKQLPGTAGETRLENVGEIQNKGFEISINSLNIDKPDFIWSTALTISANKNEVLSLGGEDFIPLSSPGNVSGSSVRIIPGQPIPAFMGATYLGTYKTPAEIDADGIVGSVLGGPRYIDENDDGAINQLDYDVVGNPNPDFYGGIRNTINYKDFTLDFFFNGSFGSTLLNAPYHLSYFGRDARSSLLPIVKDRWTTSNQTSDIPRAGSSFGNYQPRSTVSYQDGSFIRLKNVTLRYNIDIPGTKSANIYMSANNLLLITGWEFGDPEQSNYGSDLNQGVVSANYPYNSTVAIGFNISL